MVALPDREGADDGEVQAHLAEVYGTTVSRETVSKITDAVLAEMAERSNRPLESVYAAVFIDAIVIKIRDGQGHEPARLLAIGDRGGHQRHSRHLDRLRW